MPLSSGDLIELTVEKPAAGGRMIGRLDGRVVLVRGAIPGERVSARVERVEKQLAFAAVEAVLDPSADRRVPGMDSLCGGCLYAHIAYDRQLTLKRDVILDAFGRLGRIELPGPVAVTASPDRGYRMRARLHVRGARVGFYREGTHDLCDAGATGQLSAAAADAAACAVESLRGAGASLASVEIAENLAGDQRVLHFTAAHGSDLTEAALEEAVGTAGLTGGSGRTAEGVLRTSGIPVVTDPLEALTSGRARAGTLQRHAESFFQANRFLLPGLVTTVLDAVPADGPVLDLYAGVGLFSIALSGTGRFEVTAVEGDRTSGGDLQRNAAANGSVLRVAIGSVEDHLTRWKGQRAATIIVDPPRTGISREAMAAILAHAAARIVYVSCDPPTMARDARRLLDGGYRLASLTAFDLFPNTPHVEAVGVFERSAAGARS